MGGIYKCPYIYYYYINISIYSFMKKLQLRYPENKSKLYLNYDNTKKKSRLVINNGLLKQNLSAFKHKQQKEEKIIRKQREQRLPSIKSIGNRKSLSTKSKNRQSIRSKKCLENLNFERTLTSYDQNGITQPIQISQTISYKAQQFFLLLEHKNIVKNRRQNICISSSNFKIILCYIITQLNSQGKNITQLLASLFKQSSFDKFMQQSEDVLVPSQKLKINQAQHLEITSKVYDFQSNGTHSNDQSLSHVKRELKNLSEAVERLQGVKHNLSCKIAEQQQHLANFEKKKSQLYNQIKYAQKQLKRLSKSIDQNTKILLKVQQTKLQLQNFVNLQANKIVKEAAEYHKNVETDMFEYEDYLRHHPLGKKQFEHSIYYTEIQRLITQEIQRFELGKSKQTDTDAVQKKTRSMDSFFEKIKHQYGLMIEELHHAIDEKTKFIKQYCRIVFLWYENYLTKTQFLGNLKKAFSLQVINIEKSKKKFCHQQEALMQKCPHCGLMRLQLKKLFSSIDKAIELFGMGNSFY